MIRIRRMIFISTAIILCILTAATTMCTYVYTCNDDVGSTRLFAVPISVSIQSVPAPSLTIPERKTIISWLRKEDFLYEKDEVYKLSPKPTAQLTNIKDFFNSNSYYLSLYICTESTSYYMRI